MIKPTSFVAFAVLALNSLSAQQVVHFPQQDPDLANGWYLDATLQINNPAPPSVPPADESALAAGPNAQGLTAYNTFTCNLSVEPSVIKGGAAASVLNTTFDKPMYQDVDFATYVFSFDSSNADGYTNPMAGGSCSLSGSVKATAETHNAFQDAAARVAAGQRVEVDIGGNTALAQDQKACAVACSTSTFGGTFTVPILGIPIPVTVNVNSSWGDNSISEERRLGASSTVIASQSASTASVAFRSEAEVKVKAQGNPLASSVTGAPAVGRATAASIAEASFTLTASKPGVYDETDVVVTEG